MKYLFLIFALLFYTQVISAQPGMGFKKEYSLIHSSNIISDKNFYLLTVIERTPEIKKLLGKNVLFKSIFERSLESLKGKNIDSCNSPACLLNSFKVTSDDSLQLNISFREIYKHNTQIFDKLINSHLRPSGCYERYSKFSNLDFFLSAWGQSTRGINIIIDQFGLGKKMRYPKIDSASYDTKGDYYKGILKSMLEYVGEEATSMDLFYQPTLRVALQLMDINDRDEPARLEPLEKLENKNALAQMRKTNWNNYPYASIEVPGSGPDVYTLPISPICKIRCCLAALRYKLGWAPFIIVSGGYVHPFHTSNCEALEMKKYLIQKLSIPSFAIIIEPQARHTTTNLRNVNRLIYRYGIPSDKPSVFVSTKSQVDWVMDQLPNQNFDNRCMVELGYLPYRGKKRISDQDMLFYPTRESLHMDPYDPLDP